MNTTAMTNSWNSWVRMFEIPEVCKHKDGFTVYKVISFLYPEACPDAITRLIVWKRFNDFKKLHKEIKNLHKKLKFKDDLPALPKSVLFKRFDDETINQRKKGILMFLEFIGSHSELFTSTVTVKFFESSLSPEETHECEGSDLSDSDSFTSSSNLKKPNSLSSISSQMSVNICNVDNSLVLLENDFSSTPNTQENVQYLVNASMHVNMAIELEKKLQFDEAFSAYSTAVDILISNGKDDRDYDRKQMVRYKTEKYLIRAEKIYNMYLAPEIKELNLQKREEANKPKIVKGPLYNLYKYKVIKIISPCGMLVLHSEQQQLYYIKVIHKTVQFLNNHLILPENVPYMVKLINHYNTDNALFLVLEYCSGTKLRDVLDNRTPNKDDNLLRRIQESDNESEHSFSDLLSDYALTRKSTNDSDDSFEKIDVDEIIMDQPVPVLSRTLSDVSSFASCDEFDGKSGANEEQIVRWMSQLLVCLERLHGLGVICRDLSMDNLLIDDNDNLVLTYMCNIKELCDLYVKEVNLNLAPEIYSFEEVTAAVDWWSFGAILYELLVGMPLAKVHPNGVNNYTHLVIPKYVCIEGKSLLKQLLIFEPQERLGANNSTQHLKSHPFFRSINWANLETAS